MKAAMTAQPVRNEVRRPRRTGPAPRLWLSWEPCEELVEGGRAERWQGEQKRRSRQRRRGRPAS